MRHPWLPADIITPEQRVTTVSFMKKNSLEYVLLLIGRFPARRCNVTKTSGEGRMQHLHHEQSICT